MIEIGRNCPSLSIFVGCVADKNFTPGSPCRGVVMFGDTCAELFDDERRQGSYPSPRLVQKC